MDGREILEEHLVGQRERVGPKMSLQLGRRRAAVMAFSVYHLQKTSQIFTFCNLHPFRFQLKQIDIRLFESYVV